MPTFRSGTHYCQGSHQASFCHYTLRRVSVSPELTLGSLGYLFLAVAPHPNCPRARVLDRFGRVRHSPSKGWCSIGALPQPQLRCLRSQLHCAFERLRQELPAVKLHGVFSSQGGGTDRSPSRRFTEWIVETVPIIVDPFMHARTYQARHMATLREL